MTIGELVKQGLYYARTCKSLWLFGFFVGLTSGGGSGNSNSGADSAAAGAVGAGGLGLGLPLPPSIAVAIIGGLLLLALSGVLMRFISGGALIEGVARVRAGGRMTTADGFRAGWAHWGVLFRIAIIYGLVTILTLVVVGVPVALVFRAFGVAAGVTVAIPAVGVAVPWLVTLYLVQAFASQIAVLEDRRALDAIAKARLFLHGRLIHGLKLVVATFLGTLVLVVATFAAMVPVGVLLVVLARAVSTALAIGLGLAIAIPLLAVMVAMIGTLRSSIWTVGYVSEARA